jgi:hypothetical protein
MNKSLTALCFVVGFSTLLSAQQTEVGVLLLAHGGAAEWNARVMDVAKTVDATRPTEVALGMASRAAIQTAVDRLTARGATEIVAVPMFISSWSSVITSTEYLLGARSDKPAELAIFAKMTHGSSPASANAHAGHDMADPTSRVTSTLPIRMTAAFNQHPLIGEVLVERARSISESPANESLILVAHGPVSDDDNEKWLIDLRALAVQVNAVIPFASVEAITVRDDAGPPLREAATRELRGLVERNRAAGRRVLIVPHLLSYGGIETGLRKRLEGLEYRTVAQGLLPDPRIAQWVLAQVSRSLIE